MQEKRDGHMVILLFLSIMIISITQSLLVGKIGISIITLILLLFGVLICKIMLLKDNFAVNVFLGSFLIRQLVVLVGLIFSIWTDNTAYLFNHTDSKFFYNISFLPINYSTFNVLNYPGFYLLNHAIVEMFKGLGGASYLINVALIVWAGSILPILMYKYSKSYVDFKMARLVALLVAFHPGLIAYSAVLLRGALILLCGMAAMYFVKSMCDNRNFNPVKIILVVLLLFLVYMGRDVSFLFFTFVIAGIIVSRVFKFKGELAFVLLSLLLMVILSYAGLVNLSKVDDIRTLLLFSGEQSSGITAMLKSNFGNIAMPVIAAFQLISPFPFYSFLDKELITIVDVLAGIGGLINSLVLGYFIISSIVSFRKFNGDLMLYLSAVLIFAAWCYFYWGDSSRYYASHVLPIFILVSIIGMEHQNVKSMLLQWIWIVFGLNVLYLAFKLGADWVIKGFFIILISTLIGLFCVTAERAKMSFEKEKNKYQLKVQKSN